MPKGNHNPVQTEEFKKKQYKAVAPIPGGYPLAKKPISIKLPTDVDEVIRNMPDQERSAFLRELICNVVRSQHIEK